MGKISVVIITYNEEHNINACLESVQWADEIVVVDTGSTDDTVALAKQYTNRVFSHKHVGYVEPVRNFAISKAKGDWILLLDADERIPQTLVQQIQKLISESSSAHAFFLPRKNIIFGKWMEHTGWWPDYNMRLFKKGAVIWQDKIHSQPNIQGKSEQLDPIEENAIVHQNYVSVSQYMSKLLVYTDIEASEQSNKKISWLDMVREPAGEFLRRYFAGKGYKDGMHGLILSILQAFSVFLVQVKVWEKQGFSSKDQPSLSEVFKEFKKITAEFGYWFTTALVEQAKGVKKAQYKIMRRRYKKSL